MDMSKEIEFDPYLCGGLITIILSLIMVVTGQGIFFLLSSLMGIITAVAWFLFGINATTRKHIVAGITAIALLLSIFILIKVANTSSRVVTNTYHEIYSVTAPFGVIWVDQTGELSGGLFYAKGEFSSALVETYLVKYMQGNQLLTVKTESPLVVDGNFTLQEQVSFKRYQNSIWPDFGFDDEPITEWIIHIPSLPSTNQTLNGDYIVVP